MSTHSHTRVLIHMIWAPKGRQKVFNEDARKKLSNYYYYNYSKEKEIFMNVNFVNADHVHALIDLPTDLTVEKLAQLYKGSSSRWINQNNLVDGKFKWGRGYGAFSISESHLDRVVKYIRNQEEHHRTKTFMEEYKEFINAYNLEFREEMFM